MATWGIEKVKVNEEISIPVVATTDSGTNIKKACEISNGAVVHNACFAHKMHRVMLCSIGALAWLEDIFAKIMNLGRNVAKSGKQKGAYKSFFRISLGKAAKIP